MKPFWIVVFIFVIACSPSKEESSPAKTEAVKKRNNEVKAPVTGKSEAAVVLEKQIEKKEKAATPTFSSEKVVDRVFKDEDLAGFEFPGSMESGLSWSDKAGRNKVIFSKAKKKSEVTLHITHFLENLEGKTKKIGLKEYLYCDRESFGIHLQPSFAGVQDLDNNGIGEATFAYKVLCDDGEANAFKVFLLEKGTRYKLSGAVANKDSKPGKFEASKELARNPIFSKHLESLWKK